MRRLYASVLLLAASAAVALSAQTPDADPMFRVFLRDGLALPSYGESAKVGDRVVFALMVGAGAKTELQLMSLPAVAVDLEKTTRYAEAKRAAHYAATRGEADYGAMTAEVRRALDHLAAVTDSKQRLALAEEAKRRLLAWSKAHYSYRADDIRILAGLFDEVIAELRAAAGESKFAVDFNAGPAAPASEPLLPAPTLRESIAIALATADAADTDTDRVAILRAASIALPDDEVSADLRAEVRRRLDAELAADQRYQELAADVRARAQAAMRRGDVRGVAALDGEVRARDRALRARRPRQVEQILQQLRATLEKAQAYRLVLDRHAFLSPSFQKYERSVRPTLSGLDGLTPILERIQDMSGPGYDWLMRAVSQLDALAAGFARIAPPVELADVHATIRSALHMAQQACEHRRVALITASLSVARAGSAAASGAQLLASHARKDLLARLQAPKIDD